MLSVQELRSLGLQLKAEEFCRQLGPFVLVQRPGLEPGKGTPLMGLPPAAMPTTVAKADSVSSGSLSLLFEFDNLAVASIPPLAGVDQLCVGRQPDCDLVIDDPSVSKQHAILRWDAARQACTLEDLRSLNGTWLNIGLRVTREMVVKNGDIVSFGEVQYWFLLTTTLHEKLRAHGSSRFGA